MIVSMTHWSGTPKPASPPVAGWIQPMVISPLAAAAVLDVLALALALVPALADDDVEEEAPWMPELHASRRAPPPATAAPTPAARNRLRRETPFSVTI
jgi:hypothetical protein